MAKYKELDAFYTSEEWRIFRMMIIIERGLRCEKCGQLATKPGDLTVHHKIELTLGNYKDPAIAFNPDNVEVVHSKTCHNEEHTRTGANRERVVFLVYGPPLSGKRTHVRRELWPGDLVVDMDEIFRAIAGQPLYTKPNNLLPNALTVRDALLDNIRTRYGKWDRAWIVGGYPDKYQRDKLAADLGAEVIEIKATREECLARLKQDRERSQHEAEWIGYIDAWFAKHTE